MNCLTELYGENMGSCRDVEDPPTLVWFDGRGLKIPGSYCFYYDPAVGCATELVYFDGVGLRSLIMSTPVGGACPSVSNACDFDGRGLRLVNLSGTCYRP
jgi:hypothetical protein